MFGLNYTCIRGLLRLIPVLGLREAWGRCGGLLVGVLVCLSFG